MSPSVGSCIDQVKTLPVAASLALPSCGLLLFTRNHRTQQRQTNTKKATAARMPVPAAACTVGAFSISTGRVVVVLVVVVVVVLVVVVVEEVVVEVVEMLVDVLVVVVLLLLVEVVVDTVVDVVVICDGSLRTIETVGMGM